MKSQHFITTQLMSIMLIASLLFSVSCEKEPEGEQPELPPLSSILMDFSDFTQQQPQKKSSVMTMVNFSHAYTNVLFWNAFTTVTFSLPAAAYVHMLDQDPEYQGNNTWKWYYEFTWNSNDYKAILTAERLNNEEFTVDLSINQKDLPGKGITWFDGVVRYDHTHASWNLYKIDLTSQKKVIEAEWNWDYETESGDLKYTYVEDGHEEEGSYIKLDILPADPVEYDAAYTISLSAGMISIEWNRTTHAGRIMDQNYFGDELWHCWNENLMDVDCPV